MGVLFLVTAYHVLLLWIVLRTLLTNGNAVPKVLEVFSLSCWGFCCLTWGYIMSWSHLQTLWLEFAYVLCRRPVIPTTNRISIFYMSWSRRQRSPPSPPPDTDEPQGMATLVPYTVLTDRSRRSKKPHSWSHILRFSLCIVHLTPSWRRPPGSQSCPFHSDMGIR